MKILFDDKIVYFIKDTAVVELCDMPVEDLGALALIQKRHPDVGFQFYLRKDGRLDWKLYYLDDAERNGKRIIVLDKQRSE